MKRISVGIILALLLIAVPVFASFKDDVKKGNLLYNNNKYAEAAKLYGGAASEDPSSGIGAFNMGLAVYKQNEHKAAIEKFNNAIASDKPEIIPAADYNIGNAQYRLGVEAEKTDIKKAAEYYETALKFYKRSMDLDPNDKDAKFNYEFAEKRMNDLAEKYQFKKDEKKDQDKKKDQQKNKDQQKQDQQQKDKQQQNQQQQSQQHQDQQKKEDEKKDQEKQKEEPKDKGQEQENEGQGGQGEEKPQGGGEEDKKEPEPQPQEAGQEEKEAPQPAGGAEEKKAKPEESGLQAYQAPQSEGQGVEMSEQEAKMMLEGYKGEEATGRAVRLRQKKVDMPEPTKDW